MQIISQLVAILLVSAWVCNCAGQEILFHPYRRIGEKYYNLMPVYKWLDSIKHKRPADITTADFLNRPMKDWYGGYVPDEAILTKYVVIQVLDEGLLVEEHRLNAYRGTTASD